MTDALLTITSNLNTRFPSAICISHAGTSDTTWGIITGDFIAAQTFTAVSALPIIGVSAYLRKAASPVGTLVMSFRAVDGEGKPTGADIRYVKMAAADLTTLYVRYYFDFSPWPFTPVSGTKYALVCSAVTLTPIGKQVHWNTCTTLTSTYTGGQAAQSTDAGVSWTLSDKDRFFELYNAVDTSEVCLIKSSIGTELTIKSTMEAH